MFVKLLIWLFGGLSIKGIHRTARILRWLIYPFTGSQRNLILANLAVAFPEKTSAARHQIMTANVQYMLEMGLECLHLMKHPDSLNARLLPTVVPPELGSREKGEIWCALHMGQWEAMSRIVRFSGGKTGAIVTAEFDYEPLNAAVKKMRACQGTEILLDRGAAIGGMRILKQNKLLGILIDQTISPRNGGEFVNFFGLPAATSKLPGAFALKLDVPVVVCTCLRQPDGMLKPIARMLPKPSHDYADATELTQAIIHEYETLIQQCPEQYVWMYRRWRHIPGNTPKELADKFPFYAKLKKNYSCQDTILESCIKTN